MKDKRTKTILLNSLIFLFCIVIIVLYCLVPAKKKDNEIVQLQSYEIIFDTDGGTEIPSMSIEEGHAIEAPAIPTKEGYVFDGWVLGDDVYNFGDIVNGNLVLKARWKAIAPDAVVYTVTFDTAGGNEIAPQSILENGTAYEPGTPTRDGYEFIEWQLNGVTYDFGTAIVSDITLVAIWREADVPDPNEGKEWNVTFDLNGADGSAPAAQKVVQGKKATAPSERPTRTGYDFVGWNTNKNANSSNISSYVVRDKDVKFYAIWKIKKFTVTLVDAGNCKNQSVEYGKSPSNCTPTKTGYGLDNWTSSNGETKNYLNQFTVTDHVTITANWTKVQTYNYSVTYNLNGGSGCTNPNPVNNVTATSQKFNLCTPNAPNALQTFDYWEDGNGNHHTNSITLTPTNNSVTLTAHYKANTFNLSCVETKGSANGGSGYCIPSINGGTSTTLILKVGRPTFNINGRDTIPNNNYNSTSLQVCLASNNRECAESRNVNKSAIVMYQ